MSEKDELEDLLATLRAAQQGDLTVRAKPGGGSLGEIAQTANALLAALEERAAQISYAATCVAIAAEATSGGFPEIAEGMAAKVSVAAMSTNNSLPINIVE